MIVDLLTGGNLAEALAERGSLPESDAKQIFVRIVSACEHMHSRGVVHRDLKLENIMLVNGDDICNVRVVDFGLAAMGRTKDDLGVKPGGYHPMPLPVNEGLTTLCGTPLYVAPEVVEAATLMTNRQYGSAVDMWSAGVILFMLLGGYPPFAEQNIVALFKGITKGFSPTHFCADPVWSLISDDAKNLLQALLTSDPLRRITASEALQHPWCRADMM